MDFTKISNVPWKNSAAFTLVELVVSISIAMILLIFSIAPYNFYANKARVRLSSERIEQSLNKAKLLVGTGYSPRGNNVDLVLHFRTGESKIVLSSIPVNSPPISISNSLRVPVETVALESNVTVTQLANIVGSSGFDVVFRSPMGNSEIWRTPDDSSIPVVLTTHVFSGGIVGIKGALTGTLSKSFQIIR